MAARVSRVAIVKYHLEKFSTNYINFTAKIKCNLDLTE